MREDRAEEEFVIPDPADGIGDRLIPIRLHREAAKDGHEGSNDDPGEAHGDHDLHGESDRRQLKDAPIEEEDGQFRRGDGKCVC